MAVREKRMWWQRHRVKIYGAGLLFAGAVGAFWMTRSRGPITCKTCVMVTKNKRPVAVEARTQLGVVCRNDWEAAHEHPFTSFPGLEDLQSYEECDGKQYHQ